MRSALPLTVLRVPAQEGNKTLTLALVWQLMRAYTLALLSRLNTDSSPIVESEIISWANTRLAPTNTTIRHFQVSFSHIRAVGRLMIIEYSFCRRSSCGPGCRC